MKKDRHSLTADVRGEKEAAVQFVITEKKGRWEETEVTYDIKHKGKTRIVKSKIGIKLSEKLAKQKGVSIFGEEEHGKK